MRKRKKQKEESAKQENQINSNRIAARDKAQLRNNEGQHQRRRRKFKLCTTTAPAWPRPLAPAALIRLPSLLDEHKNHFNSIGLVVHCSRARKTEWKSWPGTAQGEGGRGGGRAGLAVREERGRDSNVSHLVACLPRGASVAAFD